MKIIIADTYEELSYKAADDIIETMQARKQPLICTASGDSPAGLYHQLVEKSKRSEADLSNWNFVGLDEWVGLNADDEGSCKYHLDRQLFNPLQISSGKICFFDGRAKDLHEECEFTENYIEDHGGIDVAVLGVGMNGHVGMNEPGTSASLYSHVIDLDPITQKVGQKYFAKKQALSQGITLGLATLMNARSLVVIVSGQHKAEIVQKMIEEPISDAVPATLLRNHINLRVYLDRDAASRIVQ